MHRNILLNLRKVQMGKIVTLCDNNAHKIRGKFGLWNVPGWINGLLHDLWVTAQINSLPEVKLPIIEEGESSSDRLAKTLLYEWGTARLELRFLLGDPLGNWASFGETAVKNSSGYRYRKHRALDLITDNPGYQLEEDWKLGCQLINVGFGDLKDTDKLDFTGAWTQEFIAVQSQPPYVINNVYGNSGTPTTPVEPPVLTITVSNGTTIYPVSGTVVNISLINGGSSKAYTATWKNGDTLTAVTLSLTTDANGSATIDYDSTALASLSNDNYKLEIIDEDNTITSNELPLVLPTVTVTPASIYNSNFSTATINVSGVIVGTTYTLGFIDLNATTDSRTQTAETTTFNFVGSYFTSPGTYKARLTKGTINIDSNDLIVTASPVLSLTTARGTIALFSENTQITASIGNLQPSTALTYYWIKNNVQLSAQTATTNAQGNWSLVVGATTLQNSPYGEGSYKIRIVQGVVDLTSTIIALRTTIFYTQPSEGQVYDPYTQLNFDLTAIPVGANFTYQLFKSGVALGSPVNQIFTNLNSGYQYHRITFNTANIFNSYGYSDFYTLRITYDSTVFISNTFKLREPPPITEG